MRLLSRALLVAGTFTGGLAVLSAAESYATNAPAASSAMLGFGGAVLVGDGEVFVGEAANQFRPGAVYRYRKSGAAWQQVGVLNGPSAAVGDRFGTSLALDGDRLFVGAGPTMVHVFTKQGSNWQHASTLSAATVTGAATLVQFGAMAVSGEWLLIGRPAVGGGRGGRGGGRGGPAPVLPAGEVFAFKRGADGSYTYQSTLKSAAADAAGDNFGASIALSGTTALIGAPGAAARAGVAHEFTLNAQGAWAVVRTFASNGLGPNDSFGSAIAMHGDQAVVTAPGDAGNYGAVYVFRKVAQGGGRGGQPAATASTNMTWVPASRLTASAGTAGDGFGFAIAADAREVWVGAPGASSTGGVFVYTGSATGLRSDAVKFLTPSGVTESVGKGSALSLRGNVAAVGAIAANRNQGGVFIYERDNAGTWRMAPMLAPTMDEIASLTGAERKCSENGKVEIFDCSNAELQAFLPPSRMTFDGHYIEMNDIWGWTDPQTGKEWAVVGRRDGTTFVDISNPGNPVAVADLPLTEGARPASWRDMKVYKDHAYIVSDGAGPHGMQVVDLTRLRTLRPVRGLPVKIDADVMYREINSAHNIVINEESGYAYSVGSSQGGTTCGGGLHMIDIREPKKPTFAGCFADTTTGRSSTGYSHDAQCVNYRGPDTRYTGREICIGSNETAISVADVTDKKNPKALSRASYPRVAYAHQGWFDEGHRYFYLDDEIDELSGVEKTRTLIWDLADLENPKLAKEHMGTVESSDHNLYIKGNLMYQANYRSGLRILDISNPENPREVGFFKTAPYYDNGPGYNGAWSVYPYFKSGSIVVNSIEQGLFVVKHRPIIF
jgi:choice-of-anchor B domain-containing protein